MNQDKDEYQTYPMQSASARLSGRFSLAAVPGGDNSTQKITVEKQRAVHFSSKLLGGKLKPGGVPLMTLFGNRVRPLE